MVIFSYKCSVGNTWQEETPPMRKCPPQNMLSVSASPYESRHSQCGTTGTRASIMMRGMRRPRGCPPQICYIHESTKNKIISYMLAY